jgi:RNA polymerase sigma-70 factor (ECF subfamily)
VDRTPERALDEYLVSLSRAGSVEAMDGLARRWTPRLLRYTTRLLGGSPDAVETARDIVQETWVGVIRGLRGLRDPAQFPSWIYGIATRRSADAIRARTRRRRLDACVLAGDASEPVASPTSSEQQIDLANAIRALPPIHRAAVHLFYLEDLTVEEIASVLGTPAGTVKSRLHHARAALRRQLRAAAPVQNEAESRRRGIS